MKLHRLRMTAIGPFANNAEIDFNRLGESGLFLLEGPTGSGKSTIIDAVSFALYGKVAQSSGVIERIKSHHTSPAIEPVVELVFETQSGLFRIRRTPSYERVKARGTGLLMTHMSVKLFRLTSPDDLDGGELISNRMSEAEDEITRVVGLNHPQFAQTVVLPQGEFANFLRADTNTKRALLQRLFGTEVLARTQEVLIEGRRAAQQQRDLAERAISAANHRFVAAAQLPDEPTTRASALVEAGQYDELTEYTGRVVAELRAVADEATAANKRSQAARVRVGRAYQEALELTQRYQRRQLFRARDLELHNAQPEYDVRRDELAAAERARSVEPEAEALAAAKDQLDQAQAADERARDELSPELASRDIKGLRSTASARRTKIGKLAEDLRRERELDSVRQITVGLGQQLLVLSSAGDAVRTELAQLPKRIAELASARERALACAVEVPALLAELQRADERLIAAERAVEAEKVARDEEQVMQALLQACEQQEARLAVLRQGRLESMAGDLGLKLTPGTECVVCGSVEHPRPATPKPNHVTDEQVSQAEAEANRNRQTIAARTGQLERQRLILAELQVASDSLSVHAARSRRASIAERLALAQTTAGQTEELGQAMAESTELLGIRQGELTRIDIEQAALQERRSAATERLKADETQLRKVRGPHASVADLVAELEQQAEAIDRAVVAAADLDAATGHALNMRERYVDAIGKAQFADQDQWQSARRDSSRIAWIREYLSQIDAQRLAVADGLAEPGLSDPALDDPLPDVSALAEAVQAAEATAEASAGVQRSAIDRATTAARHQADLVSAISQGRQLLLDTAAAIRLGNLVSGNGDNQLKMELTTYVLVRRFAEIVAAANTQLRQISGGRYELLHTEAKLGNARSGLGLLVSDLHTGRTRDPATLSGGETFYVSLSLALGLADVVRAESGGVDLGTLFIDEGFGSLDPDVLDEVMGVLDGLRAGGRTVGVVSHVAELKARIADRIEIRPLPDGSSQLRVTA